MLWPPCGDDTYIVKLPPFGLVLLLGAFASLGAMVLHRMPGAPESAIPASLTASAEVEIPSEPALPSISSVTKPSPAAAATESAADVVEEEPMRPAADIAADDLTTIALPLQAAPDVEPVGRLPAAVTSDEQVPALTAFETDLLQRMNGARATEGESAFVRSSDLDGVALARARNLVELDYFDHYAPDGTSAFSELAAQGLAYYVAGENLARNNYPPAQTVAAAFEGLMASPGHRANILEPRFGAVGVAAVRDGNVWLYVTVFTNPR
jgi:uncharacterized protein YkwD